MHYKIREKKIAEILGTALCDYSAGDLGTARLRTNALKINIAPTKQEIELILKRVRL